MDLRSVNKLLAHSPWSVLEHEEALGRITSAARRARRASKWKVDLMFAASAASVGFGLLRMATHTGSEAGQMVMVVAGALVGYVALRAAWGRTSVEAAVRNWELEEGVQPLTPAEIDSLRSLSASRPEAIQRIAAWQSLGLILRRRDRRAVESYLASQGVAVPTRHDADDDDAVPVAA